MRAPAMVLGGSLLLRATHTHAFLLPSSSSFSSPPPHLSSSPSSTRLPATATGLLSPSILSPSPSRSSSPASPTTSTVRLTFLESNSWLWQLPLPISSQGGEEGGSSPSLPSQPATATMNLLIDPVMHDLTFGVPSIIRGTKKVLNGPAVLKQLGPSIHHLLISQGFDDHCQPASMQAAATLLPPSAKVVAPPSAAGVLEQFFSKDRIIYLSPGESCVLEGGREGGRVTVTATTGDTLGPPWQAPENGYLLRWGEEGGREGGQGYRSLYYEPHCRYKAEEFEALGLQADIVITPVVQQILLGAFPLVDGQAKAAALARALKAKVVVPMNNGDIDLSPSRLPLDKLIRKKGTVAEFRRFLTEGWPSAKVVETPVGECVSL